MLYFDVGHIFLNASLSMMKFLHLVYLKQKLEANTAIYLINLEHKM